MEAFPTRSPDVDPVPRVPFQVSINVCVIGSANPVCSRSGLRLISLTDMAPCRAGPISGRMFSGRSFGCGIAQVTIRPRARSTVGLLSHPSPDREGIRQLVSCPLAPLPTMQLLVWRSQLHGSRLMAAAAQGRRRFSVAAFP